MANKSGIPLWGWIVGLVLLVKSSGSSAAAQLPESEPATPSVPPVAPSPSSVRSAPATKPAPIRVTKSDIEPLSPRAIASVTVKDVKAMTDDELTNSKSLLVAEKKRVDDRIASSNTAVAQYRKGQAFIDAEQKKSVPDQAGIDNTQKVLDFIEEYAMTDEQRYDLDSQSANLNLEIGWIDAEVLKRKEAKKRKILGS